MGTRNLTVVIDQEGQTKIAQYGQWDGYPDGQGLTALKFLRKAGNIQKLKEALRRVRYIDHDGKDKELVASFESKPTPSQNEWYNTFISRDVGADILENVAACADDEIILKDSVNFGKDTVMCEWVWTIDFSTNRFHGSHDTTRKPIAEFDLDNLPTDKRFMSAFKHEEA